VTENTAHDAWEEEVLATWGLSAPPFAEITADNYFFPGEQHLRALDFMRRVLCSQVSAGVLTGDKGVGKSLLVRVFLTGLDDRILVVHVQRTDMAPREFLLEILRQLGVELDRDDRTDRRLLLERYLSHQVSNGRICLLIIENAQSMQPLVLEELRHIASLESDGIRLIKLLLLGQPLLNYVVDSPRLNKLVPTGVPRVAITGLSEDQLANYVAHRLRAAGAHDPDHLIPHTLISLLYRLSGGVPAQVNKICSRALAVAAVDGLVAVNEQSVLTAAMQLGMAAAAPYDMVAISTEALLLVSVRGGVDSVQGLLQDRMLIGRSELADVRIDSAFVSRYHALIVREPSQDLLLDLGSTNGVLVNSRRVVRHVLQHRDLVQIGPARITYLNPAQTPPAVADSSETLSFARTGAANNEHTVFAFGRFNETS
jgi:type II secretory pathway predicted ATPase ExeA